MRAGGFKVQQGLTSETASMVKQAVTLARRRGHAQVTPLHVAHAMLSCSSSLLRTACLQSHSQPHQCKVLEHCFNVALNRLPASMSSPMLMGSHQNSQFPPISNALVATFKRAQAHPRRGAIENQQPLLSVKIEIEQLIISILDDPSVSRVMREASFSSTHVKRNVEQIVSFEICSLAHQNPNPNILPLNLGNQIRASCGDDEVRHVIDHFLNKKRSRNIVIVGQCLDTMESVVRKVLEILEKGNVCQELRDVKFQRLPLFSSLAHFSKDEIELKLVEIKNLVRASIQKGIVLFLGDLEWVSEYRKNNSWCPIEHMVMEIGKFVCEIKAENRKFWLMGIATFQTYLKCRDGNPSLESVWDLNPLTIPADSMKLSFNPESMNSQNQFKSKKDGNELNNFLQLRGGEEEANKLTGCTDCSTNSEMEARKIQNHKTFNNGSSATPSLPMWLQQYKDENNRPTNDQGTIQVNEQCMKWNTFCASFHKHQPQSSSEKTLTASLLPVSPSSSTSAFSYDQQKHKTNHEHKNSWHVHPFSPNPSSTQNSTSSRETMEIKKYTPRFNELNDNNLNTLCTPLKKKVPWQQNIIPEIVKTILNCRSRTMKDSKKCSRTNQIKQETWLLFQGFDLEGKEKIAMELAKLIFASKSNFVSISLSNFSSTRENSTEDGKLSTTKRSREERSFNYFDRFVEAVSCNSHRVFLLEDIDRVDYSSQLGIKRAIERGSITNSEGDELLLEDAIIILSCERFSSRSRSRTCSPRIKQKEDDCNEKSGGLSLSLDLNISIEDDNIVDINWSVDDIGLLECVDLRVIFNIL